MFNTWYKHDLLLVYSIMMNLLIKNQKIVVKTIKNAH